MLKQNITRSPDGRVNAFVAARLNGDGIKIYPGDKPASINDAYAIQDRAIDVWPENPVGWKVGGIGGHWRDELGEDRLVGPVFSSVVHRNNGKRIDMRIFEQGFAAVEGEVTAVIKKDVPAGKTHFTTDEALEFIASLHVGVEIASSPFSGINDHGPLVTISDFGNNRGLILGDEIPEWRSLDLASWVFKTIINGRVIGEAAPTSAPGGPVESVRYCLENVSRRGYEIPKGTLILTGAVTGVHQAFAGDTSEVCVNDKHEIQLKLTEFESE